VTTAELSPELTTIRAVGVLWTLDQIITGLAAAVAVIALIQWFRRGRDPLAGAPQRPNRLREDSVLFAVCVYLLAAAVLGGLARLVADAPDGIIARLITGNGAQIAGIVACLILAEKFFDGGVRAFVAGPELDRRRLLASWILISLVGIGLCPVVAEATVRAMRYFAPDQPITPHPTIEALRAGPLSWSIRVALWISAAIVAPIAEEVFFRGFLQTFLVRVTQARWTAIVLTSVAFGVVHVSQLHTVIALTLLGVLMGYAYERRGSILLPIAIHAAFNLKTLVWDAWGAYAA